MFFTGYFNLTDTVYSVKISNIKSAAVGSAGSYATVAGKIKDKDKN